MTLEAYQYSIHHRPEKKMGNADALCQLPIPEHPEVSDIQPPEDIMMLFEHLSDTIITALHIWSEQKKTSHYLEFTISSFTVGHKQFLFSPFVLTSIVECSRWLYFWGARVVIPPPGRILVLSQLHDTHPGIGKIKSLVRLYVWWPFMDSDVLSTVQHCNTCQQHRPSPQRALYIHKNGLHAHGPECTLTTLVCFKGSFSWYWWMCITSGQKYI